MVYLEIVEFGIYILTYQGTCIHQTTKLRSKWTPVIPSRSLILSGHIVEFYFNIKIRKDLES